MTPNPSLRQWYTLKTQPNREERTLQSIQRAFLAPELAPFLGEVLLPVESVIEVVDEKARTKKRKIFPGYLLVNIQIQDEEHRPLPETWSALLDVPGVTGFAGMRHQRIEGQLPPSLTEQ